MMENNSNFKTVALADISYWETLSQEDKPFSAGSVAASFFYLGDNIRAREASAIYSAFRERLYHEAIFDKDQIICLFDAALYASLAQNQTKAETLWQELVQQRRRLFPEQEVIKKKTAQSWIYEAYALLKLGKYREVEAPAKIGLEGLRKGKGMLKVVRHNVREYGLADVMINLSAYLLSPNQEAKALAQKTPEKYKRENFKYGKLGYEVIFDLQFSYPDVFTPVLPGPNPEKD
jgi:hypothetical protein